LQGTALACRCKAAPFFSSINDLTEVDPIDLGGFRRGKSRGDAAGLSSYGGGTRIKVLLVFFAAAHLALANVTGTAGADTHDFYRGKRVEVLVHAPPGGTYDLHGRILARHTGKHLSANTNMIVKNMPGGGGLVQANFLFHRARPDGLTIGLVVSGAAQMEALGMPGVEYQSRKFNWIGLISDTVYTIASRKEAPIRTLEELLDPKRDPRIFGTSSPPSGLHVVPAALNLVFEKVIGRPIFKLVSGYGGAGVLRPALERGEIDGMPWTWDAIKGTAPHFLEPAPGKGYLNLIGYAGVERFPELAELGVPNIPDRVKDRKDRALLDFLNAGPQTMWSVAAPPGTSNEPVQILREAFMKTGADPEYRAEIKRVNLSLNPLPANKLTRVIEGILETPRDVVEIAKKLFAKNSCIRRNRSSITAPGTCFDAPSAHGARSFHASPFTLASLRIYELLGSFRLRGGVFFLMVGRPIGTSRVPPSPPSRIRRMRAKLSLEIRNENFFPSH
jgi:tripartite-type tricarboxylate transporter receptor subunit TctC